MKLLCMGLLFAVVSSHSMAKEPKTEEEQILYAIGHMTARSLGQFRLEKNEVELVLQGLKDAVLKEKEKVPMDSVIPKVRAWVEKRQQIVMKKNEKDASGEIEKGKAFLAKIAKEKGVQKLPSGVLYKILKEGKGKNPNPGDRVKVHYHGTLIDGTVFDSSVDRGEPITFGLNQVIGCWGKGMQKVKVGGKIKLYCPSNMAYGNRGSPPKIKPGATLVFDVDLIEIISPPADAHHGHDHGHDHSKNSK